MQKLFLFYIHIFYNSYIILYTYCTHVILTKYYILYFVFILFLNSNKLRTRRYLNNITYRELFVSKYTLHSESGEDRSYGSSSASFSKLNGLKDRLLCSFIEDMIFHCSTSQINSSLH